MHIIAFTPHSISCQSFLQDNWSKCANNQIELNVNQNSVNWKLNMQLTQYYFTNALFDVLAYILTWEKSHK